MGAITLSSLVYQSDVIFQSLPSQVWMRPTRAPSWSSQDTLIGCSSFSKPSCFRRSAVRFRFSRPQRTCSPVIGFLPNFSCAVRIASTDQSTHVKDLARILPSRGALPFIVDVLLEILVQLEATGG